VRSNPLLGRRTLLAGAATFLHSFANVGAREGPSAETALAELEAQLGGVDVIISYTPKGKEYLFEEIAPGYKLMLQEGDSFGPRLFSCFQKLFSAGYSSVCVMDTDSPTLNKEFLAEGFSVLAKHDDSAVIGPSEDGGYYVIGLRKVHREMFEGITWSTEKVTAESLRQAKSINLTVHLLPTWFDVDTGADLIRLAAGVCNGRATGYDAAHTRALLESFTLELAESA